MRVTNDDRSVFQLEEQAMLDLCDHTDQRKWTQQHLDAADLRIASIAPTPPQGEIENDCMDVNVRGPGLFTDKKPDNNLCNSPRSHVRNVLITFFFPFQMGSPL